jgi:multiple sugar transport system permease protein
MSIRQTSSALSLKGAHADPARPSPAGPRFATRARRQPVRQIPAVIRIVILTMLTLAFGLPILWLLLAPTKSNVALSTQNPLSFGNIAGYGTAFEKLIHYQGGLVVDWVVNSFYYAAVTVVLAVVLCTTAGYALATYRFRGRKAILIATMIAMVTPGAATVLPLFLEMNVVHLINNPLSVILPSSFFPFGVYLMYVYFTTSLPPDIVAAARLDGCSEFGVFWRVVIPLARPMVGLVAFFAFVGQWNNFFLVEVMMATAQGATLQVGLSYVVATAMSGAQQVPVAQQILRPEVAMAGIILAVPVIVFFFLVQRRLLRGLLTGYGVG